MEREKSGQEPMTRAVRLPKVSGCGGCGGRSAAAAAAAEAAPLSDNVLFTCCLLTKPPRRGNRASP